MQDFEAVTERLKSAEEAHKREVDEQQRRSNDLQERLVETRAHKEQVDPVYIYSPSPTNVSEGGAGRGPCCTS